MVTDNGGPAFPENGERGKMSGGEGISLRDWLAGQALAGLLANPGGPIQASAMTGWGFCNVAPMGVAREAYAMADLMLEAQKETQDGNL